MAYP